MSPLRFMGVLLLTYCHRPLSWLVVRHRLSGADWLFSHGVAPQGWPWSWRLWRVWNDVHAEACLLESALWWNAKLAAVGVDVQEGQAP